MSWRWHAGPSGNLFADADESTYVSYQKRTSDTGEEETVLVLFGKNGSRKNLPLLGDWRRAYEEAHARDGTGGMIALWEKNREAHATRWMKLMTRLDAGELSGETVAEGLGLASQLLVSLTKKRR